MSMRLLLELRERLRRRGILDPAGQGGEPTAITRELLDEVAGGCEEAGAGEPFCQFRQYSSFEQFVGGTG